MPPVLQILDPPLNMVGLLFQRTRRTNFVAELT